MLRCPTFIHSKTYDGCAEKDRDLPILAPLPGQIDDSLKIISYVYEGTNALIILTDCAASRDVEQRKSELVSVASSVHIRESAFGLSRNRWQGSKSYSERTLLHYFSSAPSAKDMKIIFEDYEFELMKDEQRDIEKDSICEETG